MKISRCRTDNQPGAVQQSVSSDEKTHCPECVRSSERVPTRARRTLGAGTAGRAASNVRVGEVDNIRVVEWVVNQNLAERI
jgi:hypothetical protein